VIGRNVWVNIGWNFGGALLPVLVAIVAMPILISKLGDERFGILAIGWVIIAYFVLSDFGVGVATKKFLASELVVQSRSSMLWTSMTMHAVFGTLGGCLLALATPWLLEHVFKVPNSMLEESIEAYLWLAASILPLLLTSFLRNCLEACERFDLVNILRIPASSINYLIPLATLQFSDSLSHMLAAMLVSRLLVLVAHLLLALRVIPELRKPFRFSMLQIRRLFSFGGWVTVSSLVGSVVLISDRMIVVNLFGVAAVTYYVTPYEIVTKLWIISASVLGALFPVLAASRHDSPEIQGTYRTTLLILALLSAPLVSLLIVFSRDLLGWWISPAMAVEGGTVAKWIALGVYFSILSQLPMTVLQATGKPDIVTKVQLLLLPVFIALAWGLSREFGSVGIAMAWCVRQLVELGLLYLGAAKWNSCKLGIAEGVVIYALIVTPIFLSCCWLVERFFREEIGLRMIAFVFVAMFYVISSHAVLRDDYGFQSMLTNMRKKFVGAP
jgi:O-antigen/teichoic acid export membrane protein